MAKERRMVSAEELGSLHYVGIRKKWTEYKEVQVSQPEDLENMPPMSYAVYSGTESFQLGSGAHGHDIDNHKNTVSQGKVVMCGPSGEHYCMSKADFDKRYQSENGVAVPEQSLRDAAVYRGESATFEPSWGGTMDIDDGDIIIMEEPGKFYRVARNEAEATYSLAEMSAVEDEDTESDEPEESGEYTNPLDTAIFEKDIGEVRRLIEEESYIPDAETILYAIANSSPEVVGTLLELRPELVSATDGWGRTPLMFAVQFNKGAVKVVLDAGANTDTRTADVWTMEAKTDGGWTAVMFADCAETVYRLAEAGADMNAKNNDGKNALDIAIDFTSADVDKKELIYALVATGADYSSEAAKKDKDVLSAVGKLENEVAAFMVAHSYDIDMLGAAKAVDGMNVADGKIFFARALAGLPLDAAKCTMDDIVGCLSFSVQDGKIERESVFYKLAEKMFLAREEKTLRNSGLGEDDIRMSMDSIRATRPVSGIGDIEVDACLRASRAAYATAGSATADMNDNYPVI